MTAPYVNVYANGASFGPITIADIEKAASELRAMEPVCNEITVAPDIEHAVRKVVAEDATAGPMTVPELTIYIDPSLKAGQWHRGRPAWMR